MILDKSRVFIIFKLTITDCSRNGIVILFVYFLSIQYTRHAYTHAHAHVHCTPCTKHTEHRHYNC